LLLAQADLAPAKFFNYERSDVSLRYNRDNGSLSYKGGFVPPVENIQSVPHIILKIK